MTYWNSKGHYAIATPKIVATFKRKRKKNICCNLLLNNTWFLKRHYGELAMKGLFSLHHYFMLSFFSFLKLGFAFQSMKWSRLFPILY